MTEAHTITEREYRRLCRKLREYTRYRLVSIERNGRKDLPWTVTVDGEGSQKNYDTLGRYADVKERAIRMIKHINSARTWDGKLKELTK